MIWANSLWRTLPSSIFNVFGSIGVAAQNMSYVTGSRNASFSYVRTIRQTGRATTISGALNNFSHVISFDTGVGVHFRLPIPFEIRPYDTDILRNNFRANISFRFHFNGNVGTGFNTMATASQTQNVLNVNGLGLSLGVSGAALSFGFSVGSSRQHFTTEPFFVRFN